MLFQSESRKTVHCQDLDKQEGFQGPWIPLLLSRPSPEKKGRGGLKMSGKKLLEPRRRASNNHRRNDDALSHLRMRSRIDAKI